MSSPAEFVFYSKTHSPEQIDEVLKKQGLVGLETTVDGEPAEPPAKPVEPKPPESPKTPEPPAAPAVEPAPVKAAAERTTWKERKKRQIEALSTENGDLKRQLEEARRARPAAEPPAAKPPESTPPPKPAVEIEAKPRPKSEDFTDGIYDPAYIDAVADWKFDERERLKSLEAQKTKDREEVEHRTLAERESATRAEREQNEYNERWKAIRQEADAIDPGQDAKYAAHGVRGSDAVCVALMYADRAGAYVAYFAEHPEELRRISDLTKPEKGESTGQQNRKIQQAVRELVRLEDKLPAAPTKEDDEPPDEELDEPAVTPPAQPVRAAASPAAPSTPQPPVTPKSDPITPVGHRGGSNGKPVAYRDPAVLKKMTGDDYRRLREAEEPELSRR